jgi:hypothetical protein
LPCTASRPGAEILGQSPNAQKNRYRADLMQN